MNGYGCVCCGFSCLKWEKYYLFCGVFVPSAFCFVHFGVFVIFKCECCLKDVVFIECVMYSLGDKW